MVEVYHVRGMLLEEATLYLLEASGYRTVTVAGVDPTLQYGKSGMEVLGRSGYHQIDGIADSLLPHRFSHPQRLLVEAKCYDGPVGLSIVRNGVGVLKDVTESWVISPSSKGLAIPNKRYHYQYAIISSSGYTDRAVEYAFTHDLYLIQVEQLGYFKPIMDAIKKVDSLPFSPLLAGKKQTTLTELRAAIRAKIRNYSDDSLDRLSLTVKGRQQLGDLIETFYRRDAAILAMLGKRLPILLIPNPANRHLLPELGSDLIAREVREVALLRDEGCWYIVSTHDNERLFSFDIPRHLLEMYVQQELLSLTREEEEQIVTELQAVIVANRLNNNLNNSLRIITFKLVGNWINALLSDSTS